MDLNKTSEQFQLQIESAKLAGIYDYALLAFGGLLGYARDGGINYRDDDLDLIFLPGIPLENQNLYIWYLHGFRNKPSVDNLLMVDNLDTNGELSVYRYRRGIRRKAGRELFWTTIRRYPAEECWKCCNWFCFEHAGYIWHHKGEDGAVKSLIKGQPSDTLSIGPEISYMGTKVHIPKKVGSCLDWWYQDWTTPRSGSSDKRVLMDVLDWTDKKTWKINKKY